MRAEDAEDGLVAGFEGGEAGAVEEGAAFPLQELLGGTEAAGLAGGEDDGSGVHTGSASGWMVPLRSRLKNGDIVEIITQATHTPSRDWLSFVVTSRARTKIRHFVQAEAA